MHLGTVARALWDLNLPLVVLVECKALAFASGADRNHTFRRHLALIQNVSLRTAFADWPEMIYSQVNFFLPSCRFLKPDQTEVERGEMPSWINFKAAGGGFFWAGSGHWFRNIFSANFRVI